MMHRGRGTVLSVTGGRRTIAIVNPEAGSGRAARRWAAEEPKLLARWPELKIVHTERPGHATVLAREALEDGVDLVVAVGGDGTANEVLSAFTDEDGTNRFPEAELGLLGGGTGGDFLRQLGSPAWPEQLAALEGPGHVVDYGVMRFVDHEGAQKVRPFLNAASAGLTGHVVARVLGAGRLSRTLLGAKGIYLWHSVGGILSYRNQPVQVQVDDGEPRTLELALATATNGQYFGGGMWIAPKAELDDGQLEVIYTGDISTGRMLGLLGKVFAGKHIGHPKVTAKRGQRLHLRGVRDEDRVLVELDGEQPGRLPAELWIVPRGIRVRVAGLPAAS
ncbi:MAG: diacylglycerol kinase family protein [Myxococcota bacterium]